MRESVRVLDEPLTTQELIILRMTVSLGSSTASKLTVSTSTLTPTGNYTITVKVANSTGQSSKTRQISLKVTAQNSTTRRPQCLSSDSRPLCSKRSWLQFILYHTTVYAF